MIYWLLYTLIGLFAGFFSGVLGIGGGILVVPSVYFISIHQGAAPFQAMHQAVLTSLVVMIFTSLASSLTHIKKKGVLWEIYFWLLGGVIVGALLGPFVGVHLSSGFLKTVLAVVEISMGVLLFLKLRSQSKSDHPSQPALTTPLFFVPFGFFIGLFASILGLGGGMIMVPSFILLGHSPQKAVATSALTVLPTSLIASGSYFILSRSLGYSAFYEMLNVKAFIALTIGTLIASPLGALSCYKIPQTPLKAVFALLLIGIGVAFFI